MLPMARRCGRPRDADGRMVFVGMSEAYKNTTRGEVDAALAPAARTVDQALLPGSSRLNPDPAGRHAGPPRRMTAGPIDTRRCSTPASRWHQIPVIALSDAARSDQRWSPADRTPRSPGARSRRSRPRRCRLAFAPPTNSGTPSWNKPFAFITDTLDADQS